MDNHLNSRSLSPLHCWFLVVFFLCFLTISDLSARQRVIINTPGEPPYHYSDQDGIIDLWVKEAFARIGLEAIVECQPPRRGLVNANMGITDGDAGRISGLSKQYPNLIQVPEILFVSDFMVFTKNLKFHHSGWHSLKPHNVAIVRGHKIAEANLEGAPLLTRVDNAGCLFRMLHNNRVDFAVCERRFGSVAAQKVDPEIKAIEPQLQRLNFYLYLHKYKGSLVTEVSNALKAMKRDGTYERLLMQGERNSRRRQQKIAK